MRVMLIGFSEESEVAEIKKKINSSYRNYIYIDFYTDVGEAEYMACIRSYDLVFIKNKPSLYLEYLNFFKELKNQPFVKVLFFNKQIGELSKKMTNESFREVLDKIFSYLDIEYIDDEAEDFDYVSYMSEKISKIFTGSPETISHLKIDYEKKSIEVFLNEKDSFSINIPKEKDFKILLYFIRHYGEVISVDSILSGINSEPETVLTSPIETGISTIRKLFKTKAPKNINLVNPIKATKRIGYSFQVVV